MQEESDAQYKNKGKKSGKVDTKSTADAASKAEPATSAMDTSTAAPATDADKDTEMTDAPGASTSGDKKHAGEMTGNYCSYKWLYIVSIVMGCLIRLSCLKQFMTMLPGISVLHVTHGK